MPEKSIWAILTEILTDLNFTSGETEKVRTDLSDLITAETITILLENLPKQVQEQIKTELLNIPDEQKNKFVSDKIESMFTSEELEKRMQETSSVVIRDYLENLIKKLNDKHKKQLLQEISALNN